MKNADWFRGWANEYDATLGKIKRHHRLLDLAVKMSGVKDEARVLDIGCGTGLLSLKFLDKADCRVTAIDSSPEMLGIFREKIETLGLAGRVRCMQASAETMDFLPAEFDIIAATVSLHHVKDKAPVLEKIHACLADGGRFVLGEIDMDTTGRLEDKKRLLRVLDYLRDELVLAMDAGGVPAFGRMYDNGKKHVLNDGEYCLGFAQWKKLCREAGFRKVAIFPVKGFERFKVLVATK
ncbi:MAG: class I SAM-dependent methyltransferase [Methanoregula sp.]|nr:class I SAM-dependent methyltransferase [Methanoregula sp.]